MPGWKAFVDEQRRGGGVVAEHDLDRLLRMVIDYSMSLLDAERATLFLYDDETQELCTHRRGRNIRPGILGRHLRIW